MNNNNNINIITLSAKAENGKDATAFLLKEKLELQGNKVLICHYADLVKYIAKTFFDWDGNKDVKGRTLLQYIGTDIVRKRKPSYWVDFIKSIIDLFGSEWEYVLIPDCRFPNEIETWKDDGFNITSLHIERLNYENRLTTEQRLHPSETALDDYKFDYYIKASNGIDYLSYEVDRFINWLKEKEHD